mmetsp:Transcript_106344/g.267482  ORF Transcript_106344/g.267482 Transcript_106344/m.267482 type:complete len:206 (-) Transcript_106344:1030-1647(-)
MHQTSSVDGLQSPQDYSPDEAHCLPSELGTVHIEPLEDRVEVRTKHIRNGVRLALVHVGIQQSLQTRFFWWLISDDFEGFHLICLRGPLQHDFCALPGVFGQVDHGAGHALEECPPEPVDADRGRALKAETLLDELREEPRATELGDELRQPLAHGLQHEVHTPERQSIVHVLLLRLDLPEHAISLVQHRDVISEGLLTRHEVFQ